ncbi:DUF2478 domain-containing protein [Bradyrhizobium sp. Rc3b]|uniref:DUF2478 domain-containing protein n=1 Tax=Bradyrhizobium sp. Rc3b TaxID=1855322 RepID=UPI0024C0C071|nr:DUF2478 domain-containing protein [Bradyrhizobium sp. Rc3b]
MWRLFSTTKDDVDRLLADFAQDIAQPDVRIAGCVQRHARCANSTHVMLAIDTTTGQEISISQPLGADMSCNLDTNGLAVVSQAFRNKIDLLVINKFAKQEAAGRGLRAEFVEAVTLGVSVLTGVTKQCLADWRTFAAGVGKLLPCDRQSLEQWLCDTQHARPFSRALASNRLATDLYLIDAPRSRGMPVRKQLDSTPENGWHIACFQ